MYLHLLKYICNIIFNIIILLTVTLKTYIILIDHLTKNYIIEHNK